MEKIIKEVLKQIPQYLIIFISTLGAPRKYPLKRLSDSKDETKTDYIQSLTFLFVSYLVVITLNAGNYQDDSLYTELASKGISTLIYIVLLIWAVFFGWKIVGSKLNFYNYLIIYCYHFGVSLVLLSLIFKLSDGVLIACDHELYENLIMAKNKEIQFDSSWFENSVYRASLSIYIIGYFLLTIWVLIGFGAYRIMNQASRWKSIGAIFLVALLSLPIHIINYFIRCAINVK